MVLTIFSQVNYKNENNGQILFSAEKLQSNLLVWPLPYATIYPKIYKNIKVALLDFFREDNSPSLSINYVGTSKDTGKRLVTQATAVLYKDKNFLLSGFYYSLLQSESPWQRNDAITFFIYLCVSLY